MSEEAAARRWAKRRELYPLIDIGGGPYMVLPECPADRHNTMTALRGKRTVDNKKIVVAKCICPQAKHLADVEAHRRRIQAEAVKKYDRAVAAKKTTALQESSRQTSTAKFRSAMFTNSLANSVPDLRGAECLSDLGRSLVDSIMKNDVGKRELKLLCSFCPVRKRCGDWALEGEKMWGEWGLVYGGMDSGDRFMRKSGQRRGERVSAA